MRSRLELIKPDVKARIEQKLDIQKKQVHDKSAKERKLNLVFVRNYCQGSKWLQGVIVLVLGQC